MVERLVGVIERRLDSAHRRGDGQRVRKLHCILEAMRVGTYSAGRALIELQVWKKQVRRVAPIVGQYRGQRPLGRL